jgi:hypothetical protein
LKTVLLIEAVMGYKIEETRSPSVEPLKLSCDSAHDCSLTQDVGALTGFNVERFLTPTERLATHP